jgi:hypothetical protein
VVSALPSGRGADVEFRISGRWRRAISPPRRLEAARSARPPSILFDLASHGVEADGSAQQPVRGNGRRGERQHGRGDGRQGRLGEPRGHQARRSLRAHVHGPPAEGLRSERRYSISRTARILTSCETMFSSPRALGARLEVRERAREDCRGGASASARPPPSGESGIAEADSAWALSLPLSRSIVQTRE